MKTLTRSILITMTIFVLSCKSDNPIEPDIDYSNADLATQLAHYKYSDSGYSLQFFPDGKFIQSQKENWYNNGLLVKFYERTGKYELEDNLVKLSDIKVNYNKSLGGIAIIWSDQEVSLVDGKIVFKGVTVLDGKENNNELWNYWTTVKWAYIYNESPEMIYNGREEYFYEFISDSPKVRWGWDYPDGKPWPPTEYKSNYTYTPPELFLKNMVENYLVEFKNNKMYWYYKPLLSKSSITSVSARPLFPESIVYK